ncbi:exopolyphosphatase [Rubrivirga sp. S365]|uniref:Exopolyphosphatase n=1 Tax=Rubrivirga litoralis TaxID=3075598 RepID=A0ABU3BTX4_9BACT|nr:MULTISPECIES: exopolyphosphatase [unclassified Rubrivirga]MDT0632690.1 exopolyphosphatase [Rubrivirga sp. F394]MDT7857844.1 exopolyphosphatase [Rubrivirga sp. S365]
MRVCAIDVGTNTVVSLVADVEDGRLDVVADEERFARLGQGVDASGRLADDAMDRVVDRLTAARATADRLGAERVVIGATSASRDAQNVGVLRDRVRDALGLDYRVIPGVEEAALSFRGALALLPDVAEAAVVDVGGGSTEVVAGTRAGGVTYRTSLDVGSVRLTERHLGERPPAPSAVRVAETDVAAALATVDRDAVRGLPLLATGSVARLLARLSEAAGDPPFVPLGEIEAWRDRLLGLTPAQALALAPDTLAGREDVAAASVLVLAAVVRALGAGGYVATPGALRHGLALWAAEQA